MLTRTFLRIIQVLAFGILLCQCHTSDKEGNSTKVAKNDNEKNFETKEAENEADSVVDAVAGNYAEIKLAQLALYKSSNPTVREIASMLEKDHQLLLRELKSLANKKGITIPLEENPEAKERLVDLEKKASKDFDKKWCKELVIKHEKTIKKFEGMWQKTEDEDLRHWIDSTIPHMVSHLEYLIDYQDKFYASHSL